MSKVASKFRRLLDLRKAYHPELDIDYDSDPVIQGMVEALASDMDDTVAFLGECTGDEFVWLSEIFAEVAGATYSQAFVDALRSTAKRYPEECREYHIESFIDEAQDIVKRG